MKFPSEGPMPRHLFNKTHFDVRRTGAADANTSSDACDGMWALCGAKDIIATRIAQDVTCLRCLHRLAKGRGAPPA